MSRLSNAEIGLALGMSHSSVSRMRKGLRIASAETLERIVKEYDADPTRLLSAAAEANRGNVDPWVKYLAELFDDGEIDAEPEVVGATQ